MSIAYAVAELLRYIKLKNILDIISSEGSSITIKSMPLEWHVIVIEVQRKNKTTMTAKTLYRFSKTDGTSIPPETEITETEEFV